MGMVPCILLDQLASILRPKGHFPTRWDMLCYVDERRWHRSPCQGRRRRRSQLGLLGWDSDRERCFMRGQRG